MWYISSWEVYSGYTAKEMRADENLPPRPGGTYGLAKAFCEQLIEHYHFRYGLEYCILRSSPVYGPASDRPKFIWNFISKASRNEEIVTHEYRNGLPILDLLYATDLCAAILAAIERGARGTINIGTGVGITTAEVAHLIVEKIGSKSRIHQHRIEAYTSNIVMDISHASAKLAWCPKTALSKGLDTIISCVPASHG
jgi:UDP-glucuronate decarboxylase